MPMRVKWQTEALYATQLKKDGGCCPSDLYSRPY